MVLRLSGKSLGDLSDQIFGLGKISEKSEIGTYGQLFGSTGVIGWTNNKSLRKRAKFYSCKSW